MARVMLVGLPKQAVRELEKMYKSVKVPCEVVPSLDAAYERISADPPALIVAEKPENYEPLHQLKAVLDAHAPVTPFVVSLSAPNVTEAIHCMRAGAFDCVARPYTKLDVLAASKRAALKYQRTLFTDKIERRRKHPLWPYMLLVGLLIAANGYLSARKGPPLDTISLDSANLSGLQWDGRFLWVADWFDSRVTQFHVKEAFFKRLRSLETEAMYHMRDAQPILICNTADTLVSVGSDLKMRIHHRSLGLPTLQTVEAPGPNPTGLVWDGKNVWSTDSTTNLLYRHGRDMRVLETIKSIVPNPVGLAADGKSLWVLGSRPLALARLTTRESGFVWEGPYPVTSMFQEGINPSGMAVGFDRLWFVSGGDPRMISVPLKGIETRWGIK